MLTQSQEDLDEIGDVAHHVLSYLEVTQVYLEYCDGIYSPFKIIELIEDMIIMMKKITNKF